MEPNQESNKVRIFFLRNENKFPVACIASTIEQVVDGAIVRYAISTHNPKDPYDKKLARSMALERLAKKKMWVHVRETPFEKLVGSSIDLPDDPKLIKKMMLTEIANEADWPQRVRDAAKLWLSTTSERAKEDSQQKAS